MLSEINNTFIDWKFNWETFTNYFKFNAPELLSMDLYNELFVIFSNPYLSNDNIQYYLKEIIEDYNITLITA